MSIILQLTPHDPIIARDGRPFGAGQGNRMRGLPWPLPSVVAGSLRTALVKSGSGDFSGDVPQRLLQIAVAGVFPVHDKKLYLPAPNDCTAEPLSNGTDIKLHRVSPDLDYSDGCDLPEGLKPVILPANPEDFKPAEIPAWWPVDKYVDWLLGRTVPFDGSFLKSPVQELRDHVQLDPDRGAADEGQIFSTTGLNISHMPRFGSKEKGKFEDRFAEVELSARIDIPDTEKILNVDRFNLWHPLGGERRLMHWRPSSEKITGWTPPPEIRSALAAATKVRMILATPAVFKKGWMPNLDREPFNKLTLVGASLGRWKAVSGWSLAPPRGPKPIRRMVPAGSVYFFEVKQGTAETIAESWLESVSGDEQEQRDGFGLAIWGTW